MYPDTSFADMYGDNIILFPDLLTAHQKNNRAVWEAYGRAWDITSESECVTFLMKLYQKLTEKA